PGVHLAGHDALAHVLGLVGRLLLVDAFLGLAELPGNVLTADVFDARRGSDLHGDLARERREVVVLGHEVRVAVDLDQHADLRSGVNVGLDRSLGGRALAEILDLLALPDAQDLDRLLDVALRLGERLLAIHHAGARAVAQRLDVLRRDLRRAHDALASALLSSVSWGAAGASSAGAGASSLGASAASGPFPAAPA